MVIRGYSGYNTRWALKVIERVFPESNEHGGAGAGDPLAVTVFFGANDACLPDRYGAFQHVPLNEYKQNLVSIVSFFKVSPCTIWLPFWFSEGFVEKEKEYNLRLIRTVVDLFWVGILNMG